MSNLLPSCGFVLAFALLAAGCTTPQPEGVAIKPLSVPAWAKDGQHPDFPRQTHIAAYAAADTAVNAKQAADMLLEELITERVIDLAGERLAGTRLGHMLSGRAAWLLAPELGQGVKRDFATDGFEAVAVSAIEYSELKYRAQGLLTLALELWRQNVPPPELDHAAQRAKSWIERFWLSVRVFALRILGENEVDREALSAAETAALTLIDLPAQMNVSLDGLKQKAQLMGGTKEDLALTASFRGRSLQGLSLRWAVEVPGNRVISGSPEFNTAGQAFCKVFMLAGNGSDYAYVQARLDLDGLSGRRLGLSLPAWRWQIVVPSRRQALLDIDVQEKYGEALTEPVFLPAATEWARLNDLTLASDIHPIKAKDYPYRLRLAGSIKVSVLRQGEKLIARAEGSLTLSDADSSATIYRYSPSALLEGNAESKPSELAAFALREAAAETLLEFGARVLALLPAPPTKN
ncbi:MAG: hypothetical protein HPKKFMNG_00554 [Planctomycetes bacterium]|nr:hypothetical protein [Planctomycetota bacterium]